MLDKVIERKIYIRKRVTECANTFPLACIESRGKVKESVYKYYIHPESYSHSQDTGEKLLNNCRIS